MRRLTILLLLIPALGFCVPDTVKVGLMETKPFVYKDGSDYSGVAVELWETVAAKKQIHYKYILVPENRGMSGLVNGVSSGEYDIAVSSTTVNAEREAVVDFTSPYYVSSLSIAAKPNQKSAVFETMKNIFSFTMLKVLGLLVAILLVMGTITWYFEKTDNPEQFSPSVLKGIYDGFYYNMVVMTTVGFGDKSPTHPVTKGITMVWMIVSLLIFSYVTGTIAGLTSTNIQNSEIEEISDLSGAKVATISGSSTEAFLMDNGIDKYSKYNTVAEGLEALSEGDVDAFVYDTPVLKYWIKEENLEDRITLSSKTYDTQFYAFAISENSNLRETLNLGILNKTKGDSWNSLLFRYNLVDKD